MSLIKCPECGKVFSDRAAHCPQCGMPTSEALQSIMSDGTADAGQAAEPVQSAPLQQSYTGNSYNPLNPKKQSNILLYVLICVVIVLAIILIAIFMHEKFGSAENAACANDSVATMQTLPADTLPVVEEAEVAKPAPMPVAVPVAEVETEVLPEVGETEEIMPAPTADVPAEPVQQDAPVQQPAEQNQQQDELLQELLQP